MDFPHDDSFKGFGKGFDGFPKHLPEDVVEYIITIIDQTLSDVQTRERLQAFQRALTALEKRFLKEYIWQRDPIKLHLVHEDGRWLLKGSTNYGDSVADEWLIVYCLRELTREFKNAWVRIYDTVGEFLLVEAAKALPKWLSPEIDENRVWINNQRLLIIPLSKEETPNPLRLPEALAIIQETPARLQHYPKVEKEVFHRLNDYPKAISTNQHYATLFLPRKVAHVLHLNPSYISPAVEAFYLRDPIAFRLLQPNKSQKPLIFPPEDFVEVSTRFTKVLYSQLRCQHWDPPSLYSTALNELKQKTDALEKAEISIKVAAGLEMLVQHKIYADKKAAREIQLLLEDLDAGDDTLPTDDEISAWPQRDDDETWLNIDFADFERELDGKGGNSGFGDQDAHKNLKRMVEQFKAFVEDEEADMDGAVGLDPMDADDDNSDASTRGWEDPEDSDSSTGHQNGDEGSDDANADLEFAEYERAYEKFLSLSAAEKAMLTDEARELARAEEAEREEDEEIKKLSEMMEAELFGHGALDLTSQRNSEAAKGQGKVGTSSKGKGKAKKEESSDDDVLDEDYHLAHNMLKAYKGQVGMAGPAGNLMGLMGVQFPLDADDEQTSRGGSKASIR